MVPFPNREYDGPIEWEAPVAKTKQPASRPIPLRCVPWLLRFQNVDRGILLDRSSLKLASSPKSEAALRGRWWAWRHRPELRRIRNLGQPAFDYSLSLTKMTWNEKLVNFVVRYAVCYCYLQGDRNTSSRGRNFCFFSKRFGVPSYHLSLSSSLPLPLLSESVLLPSSSARTISRLMLETPLYSVGALQRQVLILKPPPLCHDWWQILVHSGENSSWSIQYRAIETRPGNKWGPTLKVNRISWVLSFVSFVGTVRWKKLGIAGDYLVELFSVNAVFFIAVCFATVI